MTEAVTAHEITVTRVFDAQREAVEAVEEPLEADAEEE